MLNSKPITSITGWIRKQNQDRKIFEELDRSSKLAIASTVFLIFSAFGPVIGLMSSNPQRSPYLLSFIFAIIPGIFAAGIFLSIGNNRKMLLVIVGYFLFTIIGIGAERWISPREKPNFPIVLDEQTYSAIQQQRTVIGLAGLAIIAIGYAAFINLVRKEISKRGRLQTEIGIASKLQQGLLPQPVMQTDWYIIDGTMVPTIEVGGDYYDVLQIDEHQVAIVIGDVSGHGVGPGIISAMTKSALHSLITQMTDPAEVMANLNRTVHELSDKQSFMSFIYILLDRSAGVARLCTAGHAPAFKHDGETGRITEHRTKNLALGLLAQAEFTSEEIPFGSGDTFLLYTDGMFEALNKAGEEFGEDRLKESFRKAAGRMRNLQPLTPGLMEEVYQFSGTRSLEDDTTLVCVRIA